MARSKFVKDVGLIGFTQILVSLGGFLFLPIITKSLGPYYYGLWAQINVTISFLTPLALMGLSMAFVRFLSSAKKSEEVAEGFYSIFLFVFTMGLVLSIALYINAEIIAVVFFNDLESTYFIKLASFLVLFNAINVICMFYFRVLRNINLFSYFSIFQSVGKLFFAAVLLWAGWGLLGVITAFLFVDFLTFICIMYKISSEIGIICPKFTYIRKYLKFSIPLTPNSLIRLVIDSSDRYLITYFMGLGSVGLYSAAYSIGWLIQLLVTPIQFILYPELSKLYDEGKENQVKRYLSFSLRYFLMLSIPAVFGLTALAKPLLILLTTENYVSAWNVIPLIALAGLLAGVFQILINITHLVRQTKFNLYIDLIAAMLNVGLNLLLIPKIGIFGAALSTALSFIVMIMITVYVSMQYLYFNVDLISILKFVLASFVMYLFIYSVKVESIIGLISLIFIGISVYFISLYSLKGFYSQEVKFLFELYSKLTN